MTIPAGQTTAKIALAAVPDDLVEGDETVTLTRLPAPELVVGAASSATVRIVDKPTVRLVPAGDAQGFLRRSFRRQ